MVASHPEIRQLRFEHYSPSDTLGVHETRPRLSWRIAGTPVGFQQEAYEIEVRELSSDPCEVSLPGVLLGSSKVLSDSTLFNPLPLSQPLRSRQRIAARVRIWGTDNSTSDWSDFAGLETGLLCPDDWHGHRISSPKEQDPSVPSTEDLFRKTFTIEGDVSFARLYITAQGVYEAEINGERVGDHFLAPGWTDFDDRLQYQTYDVTKLLPGRQQRACLAVRLAEGWYTGRLGFGGGKRNTWGTQTALIAQLEIHYSYKHHIQRVSTGGDWLCAPGPILAAELYDGEKYDARREIVGWSLPSAIFRDAWRAAVVLPWLPASTRLDASLSAPVRRTAIIAPTKLITTPSHRTIVDFGQNLVGYTRLKSITGSVGQKITLHHAEVLENGELGTRPLRHAAATDEYVIGGSDCPTQWEPRFTFHGFRYVQIDGWTPQMNILDAVEAVVCHTDMVPCGDFSCSNPKVSQLFQNIKWSMRGNFLSVPTDCPQRDERLGYTGDLAVFAPTACFIYECSGILQNWLIDVHSTQTVQNGVPAIFAPNPMKAMGKNRPCAIWGDVTILAPWEIFRASGDQTVLERQYKSMTSYLESIQRNTKDSIHLWDKTLFQLGDWLDPTTSPDKPWDGKTYAVLVADMFLVRVLDLMRQIAGLLGKSNEAQHWTEIWEQTRSELLSEYVTASGFVVSDSQTAYALAICFDLLHSPQLERAGSRLAEIVRRNSFGIGTGFAGTPFVCEALARTGHIQVAYAMLLKESCPSWLYPVTMGATTIWERWDSMLPDGTINPGDMTSFNHYALGAIGTLLQERLAGLQCVQAGWKRSRAAPMLGADFTAASASHISPYGLVSSSWKLEGTTFTLDVRVPPLTVMEVELPDGHRTIVQGGCERSFSLDYGGRKGWPVEEIPNTPAPQ